MKMKSHSAAWRRRGIGNCSRCAGGHPRRCLPNAQRAPRVEPLEARSLLSTVTLSGFPATGFRADQLGGASQWQVAMTVDGLPTGATAYAESTERPTTAPTVALVDSEPHWLAGIIGDMRLRKPGAAANDVDLYAVNLGGNEHYGVTIDLYAQRIGSTLDGALSVFDSRGQLIASNDDYEILGEYPQDAGLRLGLDGDTYFVAVSSGGNLPGTPGGFDPGVPGSGRASRGSTGPYLLRITAEPDSTRPQVVGLSFDSGQIYEEPPTQITVRFSEAMNLDGLDAGASLTRDDGAGVPIAAVHYDPINYAVTYLLLDRPGAGHFRFTLDSGLVTDLADNPLDPGSPDADFVADFQLSSDGLEPLDTENNETADTAQSLGALYPDEVHGRGIRVSGQSATPLPGTPYSDHDFFRFRVLARALFVFRLEHSEAAGDTNPALSLHDSSGGLIATATVLPGSGTSLYRILQPGEYLIQATTSSSGYLPVSYELAVASSLPDIPELTNETPGPAIQVVLRTNYGSGASTALGLSQPDDANSATEWLSSAVSSLPAVGSQPIGRPRADAGDPALLAWAGGPSEPLPAGFALAGDSGDASTQFSVAGVSGSFTDPLPDALPAGTYALSASPRAIAELAELVDRGLLDGSVSEAASALHGTLASLADDLGLDRLLPDAASEAGPAAVSQASLSLGVVVGLGAASMFTVPNRRRNGNWISRALQLFSS